MTDVLINFHRHTAVTEHGMVYLRKRVYAQNKTNSSYKVKVSSSRFVSSYISSNTVSNACSKCKQEDKQRHVNFVKSNNSRLAWMLGMIKISSNSNFISSASLTCKNFQGGKIIDALRPLGQNDLS